MADENLLAKRGKALEEEYFHRKEKELIEKLRRRRAAEAQLKELSEATGIPDEAVLQTLQELGYTPGTVALLHLVPLIQVGWADGKLDRRERELILDAARLRGVTEGNAAYDQLNDWLNNRPSDEFFQQTLSVVGHLVGTSTEDGHAGGNGSVLDDAMRVAAASGGLLGFGEKVSAEEQSVLKRIAEAMGKDGGGGVTS